MNKSVDELCKEIWTEKREAIEKLTFEQFKELIDQMISSGDILRYTDRHETSQAVVYIPFREIETYKSNAKHLERILELALVKLSKYWKMDPWAVRKTLVYELEGKDVEESGACQRSFLLTCKECGNGCGPDGEKKS